MASFTQEPIYEYTIRCCCMMLAFADEVMQTPRLSDALFERMRSHFSSREIVELLLVVGWYWAAGRLMTTLDIEPDAALGTHALEMLREQNTP